MTMTRIATAVAATAVLLTGMASAGAAEAQGRRDRGEWNNRDWGGRRHHWRRHDRGDNIAAAAVIAGVAGLVLGSVLSDNDRRDDWTPPPEALDDPCAYQDCSGAPLADPLYEGGYDGGDYGYEGDKAA